jgi:hypothetical protein
MGNTGTICFWKTKHPLPSHGAPPTMSNIMVSSIAGGIVKLIVTFAISITSYLKANHLVAKRTCATPLTYNINTISLEVI